jgi:hypothetical protein
MLTSIVSVLHPVFCSNREEEHSDMQVLVRKKRKEKKIREIKIKIRGIIKKK